jgi:two-component system, cell cycle sensor histidine kinase and response regulator CckA
LLVDENVKMLRSAIKKNVAIELDLKYSAPEITGDIAQIQQVVMNLIINAAEAIGDKNGTINIAIKKTIVPADHAETDFFGTTILPADYACLTVSDNGCGMDVETQKRIFEPFFTTKFTGRGLGMSAVLGIIKSHNGSLQLSGTPGVGTTFTIYFPSSDKCVSAEATQAAVSVPSSKANRTILMVDDEESLRIIGSALLNAMGFSVITASNGREAIEVYRERESGIDLILMDLLMPVMSGIDAYRLLREIAPAIPIVICSGCGTEGMSEEFDNDEYTAALQKPYKLDLLRNTLTKFIDKTE